MLSSRSFSHFRKESLLLWNPSEFLFYLLSHFRPHRFQMEYNNENRKFMQRRIRWKTIIELESKCFSLSYFASINSSIFMVLHLCEKQSREGSCREKKTKKQKAAAVKTLSWQIEMNVKRDFENLRISVQAKKVGESFGGLLPSGVMEKTLLIWKTSNKK